MKLSVADRIYLLNLETLPATGTFLKMRVLREFLDRVHFSAEELEKWELKSEGTRINWNKDKVREIDITVSETLISMVVEAIEKSENIMAEAVPTFQKFFELNEMFKHAKLIPAAEEKEDGCKSGDSKKEAN